MQHKYMVVKKNKKKKKKTKKKNIPTFIELIHFQPESISVNDKLI